MPTVSHFCLRFLLAYAVPPLTTISGAQKLEPGARMRDAFGDATGRAAAGGKKITVVGCIFGREGKYVLMTNKSTDVELITTDNLQADLGYRVKITGVLVISKSCDMKSDKKSDKSWTHILHL